MEERICDRHEFGVSPRRSQAAEYCDIISHTQLTRSLFTLYINVSITKVKSRAVYSIIQASVLYYKYNVTDNRQDGDRPR